MSIKFENPAEAFAAVATVVIAADRVTTLDERESLFARMRATEVFRSYDLAAFTRLLEDDVERVYGILPSDGSSITEQGVDTIVQAARDVLSPELRAGAYRMAVGLAHADRLRETERSLLEQLQRGLHV